MGKVFLTYLVDLPCIGSPKRSSAAFGIAVELFAAVASVGVEANGVDGFAVAILWMSASSNNLLLVASYRMDRIAAVNGPVVVVVELVASGFAIEVSM